MARMRSGSRVIGLEQRLLELAHKDPLTGVIGPGCILGIDGKGDRPQPARNGSGMSCVMLDIDQLKQINDKYGHGVGDEVLRQVAQLLLINARAGDYHRPLWQRRVLRRAARIRGEGGGSQWAERMRNLIKALRIPLPSGGQLSISASFGAAERQDDTHTVEQLVDMAEQAMLVSKRSGRDRVAVFGALSSHRPAGRLSRLPPSSCKMSPPAR